MHPSKKSNKQRDWYRVEIETLRGLGIFVLLVLLAVAGFVGYRSWEEHALRREAALVIDQARVLFQQISGERELDSIRTEYEDAWAGIEGARTLFAEEHYQEALTRARRSRDVLLSLLDATRNRREAGEAQFLALQGRVELRRGERGEWEPARSRLMLRAGDYVKTSGNGSAEIMFADGTLYTVRPNTLFLVGGSRAEGGADVERTAQLEYGWINLNTAQQPSTVATPRAEAQVAQETEAEVSYDSQTQAGRFTTFRGAMEVTSEGTHRRLEALETVSHGPAGLTDTRRLPAPPTLVRPGDHEDFDLDRHRQMVLMWEQVEGAERYALQVSRNRLFVDNVIDVENRRNTTATLGIQGEGSFQWRVAAMTGEGTHGPWSPPGRFRVASFRSARGEGLRREPPTLEIESIQSYGSIFIVTGSTEPGASVRINGESVTVDADGSFAKTIQLGQQGWSFIETRAADAWGNESSRRNRVFVESL